MGAEPRPERAPQTAGTHRTLERRTCGGRARDAGRGHGPRASGERELLTTHSVLRACVQRTGEVEIRTHITHHTHTHITHHTLTHDSAHHLSLLLGTVMQGLLVVVESGVEVGGTYSQSCLQLRLIDGTHWRCACSEPTHTQTLCSAPHSPGTAAGGTETVAMAPLTGFGSVA